MHETTIAAQDQENLYSYNSYGVSYFWLSGKRQQQYPGKEYEKSKVSKSKKEPKEPKEFM